MLKHYGKCKDIFIYLKINLAEILSELTSIPLIQRRAMIESKPHTTMWNSEREISHWGEITNTKLWEKILEQLANFLFFKMWFYFLMLFVIIFYETSQMQCIFGKHCGYWWSGALAPVHQYAKVLGVHNDWLDVCTGRVIESRQSVNYEL